MEEPAASWLSTCPSTGHCDHLGSELMNGRPLCSSSFQIHNINLKNKEQENTPPNFLKMMKNGTATPRVVIF